MTLKHTLEECPQNPTLERFGETLSRLDSHTERTAIAMERLAAQGVMVNNHEKRLDKHDQDLGEIFRWRRGVEKEHSRSRLVVI